VITLYEAAKATEAAKSEPKRMSRNFVFMYPPESKNLSSELLTKIRNVPFDRLRVNGLRLKLFSFSVCGERVEPQKNTFARGSSWSQ
jgi:hypothetical protein